MLRLPGVVVEKILDVDTQAPDFPLLLKEKATSPGTQTEQGRSGRPVWPEAELLGEAEPWPEVGNLRDQGRWKKQTPGAQNSQCH